MSAHIYLLVATEPRPDDDPESYLSVLGAYTTAIRAAEAERVARADGYYGVEVWPLTPNLNDWHEEIQRRKAATA